MVGATVAKPVQRTYIFTGYARPGLKSGLYLGFRNASLWSVQSVPISSPLAYFALWPLFALLALALSLKTGWGNSSLESTSGEFYHGIEGLRGILAMNVFFHHGLITYYYFKTGMWGFVPSNFYGQLGPYSVTMFFFVTGFLFWTKSIHSPKGLSPRKFYVRRFRRLMPAYLGSLTVILLITAYETNFRLLVPIQRLCMEVTTWVLSGVPVNFTAINSFQSGQINAFVFQTLRIEWMFYLALPFLAWFATKTRVSYLFVLSLGLIVGSSLLGQVPWSLHLATDAIQTLALFILSCFSVGIVAAHLKSDFKVLPLLRKPACTIAAAALLLGVLFFVPPKEGFLESACLAPIFVMIIFGNDFFGMLTSRPIVYLGTISYSVYLLHGIVLFVVTRSVNRYINLGTASPLVYWAVIAAAGVIVILLASLSYGLLERPFLRKEPAKLSVAASDRQEGMAVEQAV